MMNSEVPPEIRGGERADVSFGRLEEIGLHALDDPDVVLVRRLLNRLEQVAQVEVVQRADDRAARDGRDHLDAAKATSLGEAGEHAEVEEGGPKPAAGEGETELRSSLA